MEEPTTVSLVHYCGELDSSGHTGLGSNRDQWRQPAVASELTSVHDWMSCEARITACLHVMSIRTNITALHAH
jgi:hypothetical protein